jgi:hypothetical protein
MVRHDRDAVLIRVVALIINFALWALAAFVVLELAKWAASYLQKPPSSQLNRASALTELRALIMVGARPL